MTQPPAPTLYLFCSKIASGKSTLARQIADRPATLLVSEDRWMAGLFADELHTLDDYVRCSARLRATIGPHVVDLLRHGLSVALDFPANTVAYRRWMRSLIDEAGVAHELHVFDVPDDVCKQRLHRRNARDDTAFRVSDAQFDAFTSHFVPPSPDEGFTVIPHRA